MNGLIKAGSQYDARASVASLEPALRRSVILWTCDAVTLWTLAERRSNRLDFYSSVETLGQSSVGPIRMQDCYKPRPSHVMKEGRHRGEERWTGRSSLRRFVRLIVYGRCLQRCIVISSASCAVPVAAAAVVLRLCRSPSLHVLEKVEPRVNTAYFGLTFGEQGRCIVNSATLASALRNATLGRHAGWSVVLWTRLEKQPWKLSTILSTAQRGLSAGNVLIRPVSNPFTILSMILSMVVAPDNIIIQNPATRGTGYAWLRSLG